MKEQTHDICFFCCKGGTSERQSTPKKTSELSSTHDEMQETNREKTAEIMIGGKTENKTTDSNATEQQQLEEIPLKELAKDKTESSKNVKESKAGKIDPSSKTRRSSKSPLLEKLLSPGRRSRRSQKDKTKTENSKTTGLTEDLAGESASKSEDNAKKEMKTYAEKLADSSKITEVEAR